MSTGPPTQDADLTLPERCNGPARSGNGGYASGALADRVPPVEDLPVEVTLRQPPPLGTAMKVRRLGSGDLENTTGAPMMVLSFGGATIASARTVRRELTTVEGVPAASAVEAMSGYSGLREHPFPTCFGCGTARVEGDGLRIFPGPVDDRVASLWVPHPAFEEVSDPVDRAGPGVSRVGVAVTWTALDCVGGWSTEMAGRALVLGRMTARVDARPVVGEPHVVVGRALGVDGRKRFTASTIYDSDGRIVARAEHTWLEIDPAVFN